MAWHIEIFPRLSTSIKHETYSVHLGSTFAASDFVYLAFDCGHGQTTASNNNFNPQLGLRVLVKMKNLGSILIRLGLSINLCYSLSIEPSAHLGRRETPDGCTVLSSDSSFPPPDVWQSSLPGVLVAISLDQNQLTGHLFQQQ